MASLVVDAAYVHHGTAAASADNINGWSEAALKRIKPKAFKRRLESALGVSIERACWCAARDGRVDAVATKLDKRLRKAGFVTSYRRIKMDEVVCRNRDCVAAGTCPHLHRSNPVRCRRQAGVDVDVACRALQFVTEQLMSETSWQSSTWTHAQQAAQPWLVLVAGDGDFLSLVETAKRLGAKVAVAAWRRSVHDDLVETADAFLALDDDDVVWNESDDEEDDDDDASSATPHVASPSPLLVPAQLSISGSPFGAAAPMPPAPDDELSRALAESALLARLDAATANDGGDDDELARALEESARQHALEERQRTTWRHPELEESSGEEQDSSELEHVRRAGARPASWKRLARRRCGIRSWRSRHLERTPRSWDDWARPRHPELDSDSEDGLDTRPGIVVL